MSLERFNACLHLVLGEEGGLSDDKRDPGGRTNLGIIQGTLDLARATMPALPATVDELTISDAAGIYANLFWAPAHCDDLPRGLDLLAFDAAVQHDPREAVRLLQLALAVPADGVYGPHTRAAIAAVKDTPATICEYVARNLYFYMNLDSIDQTFGLGWSRRAVRMLLAALAAAQAQA